MPPLDPTATAATIPRISKLHAGHQNASGGITNCPRAAGDTGPPLSPPFSSYIFFDISQCLRTAQGVLLTPKAIYYSRQIFWSTTVMEVELVELMRSIRS